MAVVGTQGFQVEIPGHFLGKTPTVELLNAPSSLMAVTRHTHLK